MRPAPEIGKEANRLSKVLFFPRFSNSGPASAVKNRRVPFYDTLRPVSSAARRQPAPRRGSRYTNPENPMKAIARMPAVISAMGTPFMALGMSSSSRRSRIPAKSTRASENPIASDTA